MILLLFVVPDAYVDVTVPIPLDQYGPRVILFALLIDLERLLLLVFWRCWSAICYNLAFLEVFVIFVLVTNL